MKKIIISISVIIGLVLIGYGTYKLSKSRTFQFWDNLVDRVDTDQKVIALTFDDAPSKHTDNVLDVLKDKNINATFYCIGQNIENYPEQIKAIIDAGNELGNHTYTHDRMIFKTYSTIKNEIEKTNQLIRNAGYNGEITFRPPNGKKLIVLPYYLHQHNIKTIIWDTEPDTYHPGNTELIIKYTIDHAKPGSIILLHPFCNDACLADREALPKIIDGLKNKGYKFVTISQLLNYK
jgi:chitin deacetylase